MRRFLTWMNEDNGAGPILILAGLLAIVLYYVGSVHAGLLDFTINTLRVAAGRTPVAVAWWHGAALLPAAPFVLITAAIVWLAV